MTTKTIEFPQELMDLVNEMKSLPEFLGVTKIHMTTESIKLDREFEVAHYDHTDDLDISFSLNGNPVLLTVDPYELENLISDLKKISEKYQHKLEDY